MVHVAKLSKDEALTEALELLDLIRQDIAGNKLNAARAFRLAALVGHHRLIEKSGFESLPSLYAIHPDSKEEDHKEDYEVTDNTKQVMVFEILRELIDLGDIAAMKRVIRKIRDYELANQNEPIKDRLEKVYTIAYEAYYNTY